MIGSKYRAKKTTIDGITFASKAEAARYVELSLLQKCGTISRLELQPKYPLVVNGEKICTYIADFRYIDAETRETVIEDVKGVQTPVYRLKKKLVRAIYKINIVEP